MDLWGRFFFTVHVLQEFWEIEELWDELFDVSWTLHACLPGCCNRVKLAVCTVEPAACRMSFKRCGAKKNQKKKTQDDVCSPAALQLDVQRGERLHADHVVHDSRCVWVVCAIVEFVNGACRILKTLIPTKRGGKKKWNSSFIAISILSRPVRSPSIWMIINFSYKNPFFDF